MSLGMEKIDTHVHCGAYSVVLIRGTGFDDLTRMMERANIRIACVSHTDAVFHDMVAGNARLFSALERYPRLRGYIYVDPHRPEASLAEIEKYAGHPQAVGIKSRSEYHGLPFDCPEYLRILRAAERHGLAMLHHTFGIDVARQMAPVMRDLEMSFIVGHSGGLAYREVADLLADLPNAYFDLCSSIIERGKARAIADIVGPERLIFGTDMNLISPFWTIGMFESGGFSEAELRRIYWETPKRVLKIGTEPQRHRGTEE